MGNDATQKLVDELHGVVVAFGDMSPIGNLCRRAARALTEAADALEAAQRPRVEYPHESGDVIVLGPGVFVARDGSVLNWKGEKYVPQRPPVGPEVREAVRAVVGEQLTKAGLDLNGAPYSDDGETQWPVALQLRDRLADAILARFTLPECSPVGPERREALRAFFVEFFHGTDGRDEYTVGHDINPEFCAEEDRLADALLARFSLPTLDTDNLRAEK